MVSLLLAALHTQPPGLLARQDAPPELFEQPAWQHTISDLAAAPWDGAQVEAGPGEAVQLFQTQPVRAGVEPEGSAGGRRNLDRVAGVCRRLVRDRGDDRANFAIRRQPGGDHDGAGSVLGGLLGAGVALV
jgi:hypothetical protein